LLVASLLGRRHVPRPPSSAFPGDHDRPVRRSLLGRRLRRTHRPRLGPAELVQSLNLWMLGGNPKNFGNFGWAYLFEAIVGTVIVAALLLVRYRKVDA